MGKLPEIGVEVFTSEEYAQFVLETNARSVRDWVEGNPGLLDFEAFKRAALDEGMSSEKIADLMEQDEINRCEVEKDIEKRMERWLSLPV